LGNQDASSLDVYGPIIDEKFKMDKNLKRVNLGFCTEYMTDNWLWHIKDSLDDSTILIYPQELLDIPDTDDTVVWRIHVTISLFR